MYKRLLIIGLCTVVVSGCASNPEVSYSPKALEYQAHCYQSATNQIKSNEIIPQTPFEAIAAAVVERQQHKALYHSCMQRYN